jgi:hypothetical protein
MRLGQSPTTFEYLPLGSPYANPFRHQADGPPSRADTVRSGAWVAGSANDA